MRTVPALATCALILGACSTSTVLRPDANGSLRFSGTVQAVDTGCFVDATCTATVDGIVVTTMSGERLNSPVWGEPNALPQIGQRVEVHCLQPAPGHCTLKGRRDYHLRPIP